MNNTKSIAHPETQLRIQDNIAAIKAFKQGDNALLEQYTGWGGLRDAIFNRDIFCQLKFDCGLSDDEIDSIKLTTSNGYFTPVNIINQMWALCEETLSEPPQRILDAACGTGHFFAHMPDSWRRQSELQGVELDRLSAAMAQARVPEAQIHCTGFERYRPTQPVNLTVGNPPYGKAAIVDNEQPDLARYCIHHAFALKSFLALAVGGYLCLLLPAWFLDNGKKHVRDLIAAEGGELISAVRFPDNLFQNAKVTVDCVLIKKCEVGKNKTGWTQLDRITLDGHSDRINRYFTQHPQHVLGKLAIVPMYERYGLTCQYTEEPINLWQRLRCSCMATEKLAVAQTVDVTKPISKNGHLEQLIQQCEEQMRTLQRKYRALTGLRLQQQTLEAQIKALAQ